MPTYSSRAHPRPRSSRRPAYSGMPSARYCFLEVPGSFLAASLRSASASRPPRRSLRPPSRAARAASAGARRSPPRPLAPGDWGRPRCQSAAPETPGDGIVSDPAPARGRASGCRGRGSESGCIVHRTRGRRPRRRGRTRRCGRPARSPRRNSSKRGITSSGGGDSATISSVMPVSFTTKGWIGIPRVYKRGELFNNLTAPQLDGARSP